MLHLVAKTFPNINVIHHMLGDTSIRDMSFLEDAEAVHTFWCIAMPHSDLALKILLDSGAGYVSWDHSLFVSGNTTQWHTVARRLLTHSRMEAKKLGTFLIQSFPEIFKNLSTTTSPNGTLVLRS